MQVLLHQYKQYANLISTTAQTLNSTGNYGSAPITMTLSSVSSASDFTLAANQKSLNVLKSGVYAIGYGMIVYDGANPSSNTSMILSLNNSGILDSFTIPQNQEDASKFFVSPIPAGSTLQLGLAASSAATFKLQALTRGNAYLCIFRIADINTPTT